MKNPGDERLVRYISPFGGPALMTRHAASRLIAEDDARWVVFYAAGKLNDEQREVGPPRIEQVAG